MVVVVVLMMIVWNECLILFSLFVCLFFLNIVHGEKLLLLLEYFWFFSPLLSARITSGTGCFRNMAGSWGKALEKPCRVRVYASVHTCSMYVGGTESLPSDFLPPRLVRFFFFCISKFSLFSSRSLICPLLSVAGWNWFLSKYYSRCFCSSHAAVASDPNREEIVSELWSMRSWSLGIRSWKCSVFCPPVMPLVYSNSDWSGCFPPQNQLS